MNEQRDDRIDHTEWKTLPMGVATTTRHRQLMDRDLVEAAAKGDRAAYVDLIGSRADHLFAIAQRILRDVDRAEDALQDALVIAWRDLRGLRDADRFDAWLRRLLVNVCIAQATRERHRVFNLRVLPVDGPATTPTAPCAPPSRRTLDPESWEDVRHESRS